MIWRTIKAGVMLTCLGWHLQLVAQNGTVSIEPNASENRISEEADGMPRISFSFSGPASKAASLRIRDKIIYTAGAFLNLPEIDKNVYLYGYKLPALESERITLGEMLSQAAAENTYFALVVPSEPENRNTEDSSDRISENTYTAFGLHVFANDWGLFADSDQVQAAWSQFSQRNPVIVQAEEDGWLAFSKPLAKTFLGTELEAKNFVTSRNLWGTSQVPIYGMIGN